MKRTLVFDSTEASRTTYAALITALRFGRNLKQEAPGKDVLRRERDVTRALQGIGEPDEEKRDDLKCAGCGRLVMARDTKAFRLMPSGGSVVLTQEQVELLQTRIDQGPWTGDAAIEMADALDFLGAAPEWTDSERPKAAELQEA